MGSLIAPVGEDGKLQTQTTSADSLTKKSKNKNSAIDSDMFLTLLVAEMQNQDPLEPTSNTEWVSQYATFTQVEKMGEMAESVDMLRANDLIGKEVIVKTTSEKTGEVSYKQGIVDYVLMENNKPILVIDDQKFSINDLDTVVSNQYSAAYEKYRTLKGMIDGLPDIKFADKSYENVIRGAYEFYNTFDDYQKNFMGTYGSEQMEKFEAWKKKMEDLGIKFEEEEPEEPEEPETSLDDILESFNTKMDALLEKLNLLADTKPSEGNGSEGSNKDPEEVTGPSGTQKPDEVQEPEQPGDAQQPDKDGTGDSTTGDGTTGDDGNKIPDGSGTQGPDGTGDSAPDNSGTGNVTPDSGTTENGATGDGPAEDGDVPATE